MSTDQYDASQTVRIKLQTPEGEVWSRRLTRHTAEVHVALGALHLSIEYARGLPVVRAAIVNWTFN